MIAHGSFLVKLCTLSERDRNHHKSPHRNILQRVDRYFSVSFQRTGEYVLLDYVQGIYITWFSAKQMHTRKITLCRIVFHISFMAFVTCFASVEAPFVRYICWEYSIKTWRGIIVDILCYILHWDEIVSLLRLTCSYRNESELLRCSPTLLMFHHRNGRFSNEEFSICEASVPNWFNAYQSSMNESPWIISGLPIATIDNVSCVYMRYLSCLICLITSICLDLICLGQRIH